MPGQPRRKAFYRKVEEEGGDHVILDRIAAGEPIARIAADYGFKSRRPVYDWIHQNPEREKAWAQAKKESADALVEDGMAILDDPVSGLTSSAATMAQARANYRYKLAGVRDREQYGDRSGVEINLSFGDLHLDALRSAGSMNGREIPQPPAREEIPEAEILAIEGEDHEEGGVLEELRSA